MSVHCTVSNCQWWGQGNHCMAEGILITSDTLANRLEDKWDYPHTDQIVQMNKGTTPVNTCMESCCKTFVHQKKG
ncbi:MAG: DUF1540 domain-containing protein [Bacillota bacterium]|uniref:DUF1540 domain-containing protein n=1 Tax=unclassified Candidatus Desulforudis TaxID=2635950 RepID=UPI003473F74B